MFVVFDFDGRIDAAADGHILFFTAWFCDSQDEHLLGLHVFGQAEDVVLLGAIQVESLGGGAFLELEGQNTHADKV